MMFFPIIFLCCWSSLSVVAKIVSAFHSSTATSLPDSSRYGHQQTNNLHSKLLSHTTAPSRTGRLDYSSSSEEDDSFANERRRMDGGWRYRGPSYRPRTSSNSESTSNNVVPSLLNDESDDGYMEFVNYMTMLELSLLDEAEYEDKEEEEGLDVVEEDKDRIGESLFAAAFNNVSFQTVDEANSTFSSTEAIESTHSLTTTTTTTGRSSSVSRQNRYARTIIDRSTATSSQSSPQLTTPVRPPTSIFNNILPPLRIIKARPVKNKSISMMNIMKESLALTTNNNNDDNSNNDNNDEVMEVGDRYLKMVSTELSYKKNFMNTLPSYTLFDIDYPILLQRFLDNIEDSSQKLNGKISGQSKLMKQISPKDERKTVIVLGTGWAGHAYVKLASIYDLRIVVVSPVNHFVFTPMLASAAVGTVEYRSMTEPIRVTNPYIDNFVEGRAIDVDIQYKKLVVQLTSLSTVTGSFNGIASDVTTSRLDPDPILTKIIYTGTELSPNIERDRSQGAGDVIELSYDYLLCCVGTTSRSSMIHGAKEYCFNLKTSQDSKRLRTAIGEALEMASRPDVQDYYYSSSSNTPGGVDEIMRQQAKDERRRRVRIVIVGGGPTGVELCAEISDFFAQVCRIPDGAYQHLKNDVSVMLIHGGSDLLPAMDIDLRARALVALREQGVEVRLNTRLNEVGRDYIKIIDKNVGYEEMIPLAITVWAAGNTPVPFISELLKKLPSEAAGSGGRVNVDKWLRCPTPTRDSFGSVLVLGDAACFESQSKYETSTLPLPQTAQVAGQQGAFVARMLNRGYDMSQTPPTLPDVSIDSTTANIASSSSTKQFPPSLLKLWLLARGLQEAPGFNFLSLGLLAYVGQEEALNQVMVGDVPLFNYSGKIAFALWRSVYLSKQASTRNQALIAFDWLRTETFGRDITRL